MLIVFSGRHIWNIYVDIESTVPSILHQRNKCFKKLIIIMQYDYDLVFPILDIHRSYVLRESNTKPKHVDLVCVNSDNTIIATEHLHKIEVLEYRCDRLNAEAELFSCMGIYSNSPYWDTWESKWKQAKMKKKFKGCFSV